MLPFEIRAIAPLYLNDYAARNSLAAFSTCTFLCRRTTLNVYLRHQAFRSEQSRHGWKAINSFSLWLRTRSMSKCASRKTGGHQNWTILQTQEGSYEAETAGRFFLRFCLLFLSRHLPTPRYRRKKARRNRFGAGQEKEALQKPLGRYGRKIVKGEASSVSAGSAQPIWVGKKQPI